MSTPRRQETVTAIEWDKFTRWFVRKWEPGQHVALIAPTGEGKSTLAVGLLKLRKYVIAMDAKGGDETLTRSGFKKITSWPIPSRMRDDIAEGRPCRLIASGSARTNADRDRLIAFMREVLEGVRGEGRWTCYADEFQLLCDRRIYGLDKEFEAMLVSARSTGCSVVTSFQAPAWVPRAATRQATWVMLGPTRDRNMIKSVAESMGRDYHQIISAVEELPPYHFLVMGKRVHDPLLLIHAPRLS